MIIIMVLDYSLGTLERKILILYCCMYVKNYYFFFNFQKNMVNGFEFCKEKEKKLSLSLTMNISWEEEIQNYVVNKLSL